MTREELEKLLGGYATGALGEAERKALFEAALRDQGLFEALAAEDALKEVLDDPALRARIRSALEDQPAGFRGRLALWLRRPAAWSAAAAVVATVVVAVVLIRVHRPSALPVPAAQVADRREPVPGPPAAAGAPAAEAAPRAPALTASEPARAVPAIPRVKAKKEAELPPPPDLLVADASRPPLQPDVPASVLAPPPAAAPAAATTRADLGRAAAVPAPQPPPPQAVSNAEVRLEQRAKNTVQYTAAPGFAAARFAGTAPELHYRIDHNPLRVTFGATAPGYLYVLGSRGLLLSSSVSPGTSPALDPPAGETKVTAVLCRAPDNAPVKGLVERARKRGDSVTEIPLR